MKHYEKLGAVLEAFVNSVSLLRGCTLNLMAAASVTVPQIVLLNFALTLPNSTPSSRASTMKIYLLSVKW